MIQIQQLLYFQKVAETKSMNKASALLYVTQPNLSKQMQNLEKDLKVILFERTNKGIVLTEAGKRLLDYTKAIVRQVELVNSISVENPVKYLSVSAYPDPANRHFLERYYRKNRESNGEILLDEQRIEAILANVESMHAEIGIIQYNQQQKKQLFSMIRNKNLEFHETAHDTWYAYMGNAHPLYGRAQVNIRELLQYPVLRAKDDFFSSLNYFHEIDGISFLEFKKHIFSNNVFTQIHMLRNTDAFSFGTNFVPDDYGNFGIRIVPIENCNVDVTLGWIKRKNETLSPEAREFTEIMEEFFRERVAHL